MHSLRNSPAMRSWRPAEGQAVRTPTGALVTVLKVFKALPDGSREALVEWPNGDQAHFRVSLLRPLPGMD